MPHIKQRTLFRGRDRRRGRVDPTRQLFKTHDLPIVSGPLNTGVLFPGSVRDAPFTIVLRAFPSSESESEGVGVTLGDTGDHKLRLMLNGTNVIALAGADFVGDPDSHLALTSSGLVRLNEFSTVVFAVNPGTGEGRLWVNNKLVARGVTVSGSFNGPFAGSGTGAIAVAFPDVLTSVGAFVGQLPRQFDAGGS